MVSKIITAFLAVLGITLCFVWLAHSAPGDVTTSPGTAFTSFSGQGGKIKATSNKTPLYISGAITNPSTRQITINADTIPYSSGTVASALDTLLYVNPSVSLSGGSSNEIGSTVSSVTLTFSGNKSGMTYSLNNSIGAVTTSPYIHSGQSITSNRTYTITASDGTNSATASTTVAFYARSHWGVSSNTSLTSAQILALASNEFASSHSKSVTYDCTGGRYPYFAYPASWGLLTAVTVGGLAFSDFTTDTVSHTNASGYTQNYYVVRFNSIQTGSSISVVWN